jgi:hypothetical protein
VCQFDPFFLPMVLLREKWWRLATLFVFLPWVNSPDPSQVLSKRMLVRYHHLLGVVLRHYDHAYAQEKIFSSHCLYYIDRSK